MGRPKLTALILSNIVVAVFSVLAFSVPASADKQRKALPVDQAAQDPTFKHFRTRLLEAVARRDVDFVVSQASTDIHLSFGGHSGRKDFRKFLTLSEDAFSEEYKHLAAKEREAYWNNLEKVLKLGGRFTSKTEFSAPYTWTVPLKPDEDVFATRFVIGRSVALRERPNLESLVLARLAHDIVTVVEGGDGTPFSKVRMVSGKTGFVHEDYLRSAVDYRAHFTIRDGKWEMTRFLAGD